MLSTYGCGNGHVIVDQAYPRIEPKIETLRGIETLLPHSKFAETVAKAL
jgi:hypothetical protein